VNRRESEGKFPQERPDVIIPLGDVPEESLRERIGSHCTRRKRKIHGDLMFRAWGRKRVPGGGGTGKKRKIKETGAFLFLCRLFPIPILRFTSEPKDP